jgi:hypothetical protein
MLDFSCRKKLMGLLLVTFGLRIGLADEPPKPRLTSSDERLEQRWKPLKNVEAANIARQHIQGLIRAIHAYQTDHGTLPPAVVPNPKLAAGKRLSGLVLLLPYLDARLDYDKKPTLYFDPIDVKLAKEVFESIDLKKAWDDPVNLKAAKTIIPAFLSPHSGKFRDEKGYGVTHFAFVQGSENGLDGAFPGDAGLKIADIEDGTVNTLALGQVINDLGPWIAEGLATARQAHAPTDKHPGAFGSLYHKNGCYMAFCDASARFMIFDEKTNAVLQWLAARNDGELANGFTSVKNPYESE